MSVVAPRTRFSEARLMAPARAAESAAVLSWPRATAIIDVSTASEAKPMKIGNINPNMTAATPRRNRAVLQVTRRMVHRPFPRSSRFPDGWPPNSRGSPRGRDARDARTTSLPTPR